MRQLTPRAIMAALTLCLASAPASAFTPDATTCPIAASKLAVKIYKDATKCAQLEHLGKVDDRFADCWQLKFNEKYNDKSNDLVADCALHLSSACGGDLIYWNAPLSPSNPPCRNPSYEAWATFDAITP